MRRRCEKGALGYTFTLSSQLALSRCPHCRVRSPLLSGQMAKEVRRFDGTDRRFWSVYECSTCGGWILAWAKEQDSTVEEVFPAVKVVGDDIPAHAKNF